MIKISKEGISICVKNVFGFCKTKMYGNLKWRTWRTSEIILFIAGYNPVGIGLKCAFPNNVYIFSVSLPFGKYLVGKKYKKRREEDKVIQRKIW